MQGSLAGTLLDVFEISQRGCVVVIDIESGTCKVGDRLAIGANTYEVTAIEMREWHRDANARRRIADGRQPPIGVLLRDASKSELLALIGQPVSGPGS